MGPRRTFLVILLLFLGVAATFARRYDVELGHRQYASSDEFRKPRREDDDSPEPRYFNPVNRNFRQYAEASDFRGQKRLIDLEDGYSNRDEASVPNHREYTSSANFRHPEITQGSNARMDTSAQDLTHREYASTAEFRNRHGESPKEHRDKPAQVEHNHRREYASSETLRKQPARDEVDVESRIMNSESLNGKKYATTADFRAPQQHQQQQEESPAPPPKSQLKFENPFLAESSQPGQRKYASSSSLRNHAEEPTASGSSLENVSPKQERPEQPFVNSRRKYASSSNIREKVVPEDAPASAVVAPQATSSTITRKQDVVAFNPGRRKYASSTSLREQPNSTSAPSASAATRAPATRKKDEHFRTRTTRPAANHRYQVDEQPSSKAVEPVRTASDESVRRVITTASLLTRKEEAAEQNRRKYNPVPVLKEQQEGKVSDKCVQPNGYFPDPEQCDKYYDCRDGRAIEKLCPDGLVFNDFSPQHEKCDLPFGIDCTRRPKFQTAQPTLHCPRLNGYFAHENPTNCNTFYYCVEGKFNMISCPDGLVFSPKTGICNWPDEAQKKGCGSKEIFNFTCPKVIETVAATHPRYADPEDCQYFYVCINGETPRRSGCKLGQAFDEKSGKCDWARKIPECKDWYKGILTDEQLDLLEHPTPKPPKAEGSSSTPSRRKGSRPVRQ